MARIQLGTPIDVQLARLEAERKRLEELDARDVVFEVPEDLDKLPLGERVIEIEAVMKNMTMTKVRSLLDMTLQIMGAAREGGYGTKEGEGLPAWIRRKNRKNPVPEVECCQCREPQDAITAAKHYSLEDRSVERFGRCVNCGNQTFKVKWSDGEVADVSR